LKSQEGKFKEFKKIYRKERGERRGKIKGIQPQKGTEKIRKNFEKFFGLVRCSLFVVGRSKVFAAGDSWPVNG